MKILLVEDDDVSRQVLAGVIPRIFPQLALYSAVNGREALEVFAEHLPEIILTDINMPEMSGIELAETLRDQNPEVVIIVITADTGKAALEESIVGGFRIDHYIVKPIDYKKLFAAIEEAIQQVQQKG